MAEINIVDQLSKYCSCVEDVSESDIAELVNVISLATCWMQNPCETFLMSDRREVIDLPDCMDCPMEFTPFYHPYDKESFSFSLVKIEGITETVTEITDFAYSETMGLFRLNTGLPSCACKSCVCGDCKPVYKLVVEYKAGYTELPDCLLPVFCNILEVIKAKNTCDCHDCDECDNAKYDEDNIQYATGDIVTVALETDIGKILVSQYKKQIGMISLCKAPEELWGFVV